MSQAIQSELLLNGITDGNGKPLSGGKVYTYAAGTLTNKTCWLDKDKSSVATNPVILDSAGKKLIYCEGQYKFVITNSSDAPAYTYDNLYFSTDPSYPAGVIFTSGYANFNNAVAAAAGKELVLDSSVNLVSNLTISGVGSIRPQYPGVIVSAGYTLNIGCPVVGDPMHQWLSGFAAGGIIIKTVPVNILWFGADRTGINDCTLALQLAYGSIKGTIYDLTAGEIIFPAGIFQFTQDSAFLPPWTGDTSAGFKISGCHKNKTMVRLAPPSASAIWLYKNPSDVSRANFVAVHDIIFLGVDDYANGFLFKRDQSWVFTDCRFQAFAIAFQYDGTADTSEQKFFGCKFSYITDKVFYQSNDQAVDLELYSTEVENIYGDVFYVDSDGGGTVKVYGGSFILGPTNTGGTTLHWLLHLGSGNGTLGPQNCGFLFDGIKFERHSQYHGLFKSESHGQQAYVVFRNCSLATDSTGIATGQVWVQDSNIVIFDKCLMSSLVNVTFVSDANSYSFAIAGGQIEFLDCYMTQAPVVTRTGPYGLMKIRGAINLSTEIGAGSYQNGVSLDTDSGWRYTSSIQASFTGFLKTAKILHHQYWPTNGDTTGQSVQLPIDSLIKNIYVVKPASGASATAYNLHVGNGDRSVTYASSGSAAQSTKHTIIYQNAVGSEIDVASDADDRVVRLWCTGGDAGESQSGGYAIVEYY